MNSAENSALFSSMGEFSLYIVSAYGAAFALLGLMLLLTLRYAGASRRIEKRSRLP
jgi:heme exporter protein CcmD